MRDRLTRFSVGSRMQWTYVDSFMMRGASVMLAVFLFSLMVAFGWPLDTIRFDALAGADALWFTVALIRPHVPLGTHGRSPGNAKPKKQKARSCQRTGLRAVEIKEPRQFVPTAGALSVGVRAAATRPNTSQGYGSKIDEIFRPRPIVLLPSLTLASSPKKRAWYPTSASYLLRR